MSQDLAVVTPAQDEDQGSLIQIIQLPIIKERLHHLKGYVDQQVNDAMAMVCTDDTVIEVKQIRAELSALFNEAENQRKAVKAAVMQPYLDFETVYKECISEPFRRADADLRGKITAVESEMKRTCEERLRMFFDELTQMNGIGFLKYEQAGITISMADARAKTQPPKKLREQLERFVNRVGQDVDMILTLENAGEVIAAYKHSLNVTEAIQIVNDRHKQIEQAEAEKARRDAAKTQEAEAKKNVEAFAPPVVEVPEPDADLLTCTFTINDTRERLRRLKQFLDANGYKYTN
jgi:hypothetical protein